MDRQELRVRSAQEFNKRRDWLLYRMGLQQGRLRPDSKGNAGNVGKFFVSAGDGLARAKLLRDFLPEEAKSILQEADEICGRRFRLLGYENLSFGSSASANSSGIDWHLDPVHGKHAPMDAWFTIPFLDFAIVGDHKVTWELNRHQHLITLAKAWLLSGEEKYVRELIIEWRNWIAENPYPIGINWGSSLEVAFRSLSWIWIDHLLALSASRAQKRDSAIAAFRAELRAALAFHGRYIERYLSTYFSPNTHLLGEGVALFFLGTLYPYMRHASRWKNAGWEIVLHAAERQVRADGVYFEQSLYYHVYALDFFLYARQLAALNQISIPERFDAVLHKMLNVVAALAQAGPAEGFGDDDGGRLFNPRRNRVEHLTDPLAVGALVYSEDYPAAQLTEEAIWLFGEPAIGKFQTRPTHAPARSLAFPDGGLYVLADSDPCPQVLTIDAGPQGIGRSGHGHADALGVHLAMNGRRWLVDSGSGVYIAKEPKDRDAFRGTGAHNTMRVDGLDQAIPDEPFSWTKIPTTRVENWIVGKSFTYFAGSHNGYERLDDPVTHRRHVLRIAGDLWFIRDEALGKDPHQLEVRWHFAHDLEVRSLGGGRMKISGSGDSSADSSNRSALTLLVPENTPWTAATEIKRTIVSPAYGALQAASVVRSSVRVGLPAELATVLIPQFQRGLQDDVRDLDLKAGPRFASMRHTGLQVYELAHLDGIHGFFFGSGNKKWSFGPWSSDAHLLYCHIQAEKLDHLVLIGGSEVNWQGKNLMKATRPAEYFEWRAKDSVLNTGGYELSALFTTLTGGAYPAPLSASRESKSYVEKL
jgi:hypothetical protein